MTRASRRPGWAGLLIGVLGVVGLVAVANAGVKWGPFRGQFIDVESGQPIPGGVVLVVWLEHKFGLVHGTTDFYAARAAVAGPDGRFEVPGIPALLFGFKYDRLIGWFAPGYKRVDVIVTPPDGTQFTDPTVVRMQRRQPGEDLTLAERIQSRAGIVAHIPDQEHLEIETRVNSARRQLGLPPVHLGTGEVQ